MIEIANRVPEANICIDLQENYRLAELLAHHVAKIRYNPGHLHHHERDRTDEEKVTFLVDIAREHGLAIRIGVNAGSIAPAVRQRFPGDEVGAIVQSAVDHCGIIDSLGFEDYCVSIKDSDPRLVVEANSRFADMRPAVPLHLGVTEAGLPPEAFLYPRLSK